MFKSVLNDARLKEALFVCDDGLTVLIGAEELCRVLPLGAERDSRWGPFNIDLAASKIDHRPVQMLVV